MSRDGPQETVETRDWSDRQLLLKNYYLSVEQNGRVGKLWTCVFGDEATGVVGLVEQAQENTRYREKAKTLVRVVASVAGAMLTVMVAMLVLLVEHAL